MNNAESFSEGEGIASALKRAEEDLNREAPRSPCDGYAYSKLAKAAFAKIRLFRSKGFSYAQICRAFEKNGLLPKNPNPYSLRAAFHRERRRLKREEEIEKLAGREIHAEAEPAPAKTDEMPLPGKTGHPVASEERKHGAVIGKRSRISSVASITVDTAAGRITKLSDGAFDF